MKITIRIDDGVGLIREYENVPPVWATSIALVWVNESTRLTGPPIPLQVGRVIDKNNT
jgi:hypothetical protein